jgi:hypothetical protein
VTWGTWIAFNPLCVVAMYTAHRGVSIVVPLCAEIVCTLEHPFLVAQCTAANTDRIAVCTLILAAFARFTGWATNCAVITGALP